MKPTLAVLVLTRDPELERRVRGYLEPAALVRVCPEREALDALLRQHHPALLLLDAHFPDSRAALERLLADYPESLGVVLAEPASEAARAAAEQEVFAVESPDLDRGRLQTLARHARRHLRLVRENRLLRRTAGRPVPPPAPPAAEGSIAPLRPFTRAFRHFHDVESMLDSLLEGVAAYAKAFRAGVFTLERGRAGYRLRAGMRCLPGTETLEISGDDPLVHWFGVHAHGVARSMLAETEAAEGGLLEQVLDLFGAEMLMPLQGAQGLLGWLFLGRRIDGRPYSAAEIEGLLPLAEHVSASLETALLHEEVAVQRSLADTVLFSIPVGVIAVDATAVVRRFNEAAATLLDRRAEDVLHKPAGRLPGRLGDLLTRVATLDQPETIEEELQDPATRRILAVVVRRLASPERRLGAVAIVRDRTREAQLSEKEARAERASFWAELAAAISHEVRNPLVAIKTFAQLLPERYQDEEFRTEFSRLANVEIGRLNGVIDQIHAFANPPRLNKKPLAMGPLLQAALAKAEAIKPAPPDGVALRVDPDVPGVLGDEEALTEGISFLLVNAFEALQGRSKARIEVACSRLEAGRGDEAPRVLVTITDNGPGFAEGIMEKAFSPFCTTKSRGIGLGLPMTKRTLLDHDGQIEIESGRHGTRVCVTLPALEGAPEADPPAAPSAGAAGRRSSGTRRGPSAPGKAKDGRAPAASHD